MFRIKKLNRFVTLRCSWMRIRTRELVWGIGRSRYANAAIGQVDGRTRRGQNPLPPSPCAPTLYNHSTLDKTLAS